MESYSLPITRHVDVLTHKLMDRVPPLISNFYSVVYDLVILIYALLSGEIPVGELWLRISSSPAPQVVKFDAEIQVEQVLGAPAADALSPSPPASPKTSKSHCVVSGLCRAIVKRDVDLVNKYVSRYDFSF